MNKRKEKRVLLNVIIPSKSEKKLCGFTKTKHTNRPGAEKISGSTKNSNSLCVKNVLIVLKKNIIASAV